VNEDEAAVNEPDRLAAGPAAPLNVMDARPRLPAARRSTAMPCAVPAISTGPRELSAVISRSSTLPSSGVVDRATQATPSRPSVTNERIETPGGVFYIDGASVLYLIGSTMDWQEDDFAAGFVFDNPNAKGACGCGESFTV